MSKYKEQYERIVRWYKRFEKLNQGILHDKDSNNYIDDIYAFFINCYHLKDWIKNDNSIIVDISDIENFINNSTALSICADVCNGLKHLKITSPRIDPNTTFGKKHVKMELGTQPTIIALKIEIIVDENNYDAFDLAADCIKEWENYLKSKSLL